MGTGMGTGCGVRLSPTWVGVQHPKAGTDPTPAHPQCGELGGRCSGGVLLRRRDRAALTALGAVNGQRLFLLLLEGILGRDRLVRAACSQHCCLLPSPRPGPDSALTYIVLVPHGIELLQLLGPIPGLLLGDICKGKDPD